MIENITHSQERIIEFTSKIVAGYVSHNTVPQSEMSSLINTVYNALMALQSGVDHISRTQEPAIAVKKSITPDYLICLEDGKKFKSLKRHLRTRYNMTPDEYRNKWGLPPDYPMVAPNYATARSNLALAMGLGQKQQSMQDEK
jgi:predicted transcriptional regulator